MIVTLRAAYLPSTHSCNAGGVSELTDFTAVIGCWGGMETHHVTEKIDDICLHASVSLAVAARQQDKTMQAPLAPLSVKSFLAASPATHSTAHVSKDSLVHGSLPRDPALPLQKHAASLAPFT